MPFQQEGLLGRESGVVSLLMPSREKELYLDRRIASEILLLRSCQEVWSDDFRNCKA